MIQIWRVQAAALTLQVWCAESKVVVRVLLCKKPVLILTRTHGAASLSHTLQTFLFSFTDLASFSGCLGAALQARLNFVRIL